MKSRSGSGQSGRNRRARPHNGAWPTGLSRGAGGDGGGLWGHARAYSTRNSVYYGNVGGGRGFLASKGGNGREWRPPTWPIARTGVVGGDGGLARPRRRAHSIYRHSDCDLRGWEGAAGVVAARGPGCRVLLLPDAFYGQVKFRVDVSRGGNVVPDPLPALRGVRGVLYVGRCCDIQ